MMTDHDTLKSYLGSKLAALDAERQSLAGVIISDPAHAEQVCSISDPLEREQFKAQLLRDGKATLATDMIDTMIQHVRVHITKP